MSQKETDIMSLADNLCLVRQMIESLSAAEREACYELADHIRRTIKQAKNPVGILALSLIGIEEQMKCEDKS